MNTKSIGRRTSEKQIPDMIERLIGLLQEMTAGQEKMLLVISRKHEAMRRSDVPGMLTASADEGAVANEIISIEKKRLEVFLGVCEALKIAPAATPLTIRALAARLPADLSRRLMDVATTLRERMLKVAEANRVVELVCQRMLTHFKAIFAAMAEGSEGPPTYSAAGNRNKQAEAMVLDAIG